jgi:hypothetical protein
MQTFSREQVLGLAPDPAAAKAAHGQARPAKWTVLGHDEVAVWGECTGSCASTYQCQAALGDSATSCSCPSRKFPCKHALGLLLLLADGSVPIATCPGWVAEWIATRTARAARAADRSAGAEAKAGASDPQAQLRRAANRERKVDDGVNELRRWLHDLARGGLAAAQAQPWSWWDQVARRMIDAQARGLAGYVRRLAELAATGGHRSDWPDRMLDQIGALHLMCEAWTRRDQLPAATAAALRARIGFTTTTSDVLALGERVTDCWAVLGQRLYDDGQLTSLRQWLYGARTGSIVTHLAFAPAGQQLEPGLPPGLRSEATLALYPGTVPPRALIVERHASTTPLGPLPGAASWDEALASVAEDLAVDPWADILPVAVRSLTVLPTAAAAGDGHGQPWLLRDAAGRAVPLAASIEVRWRLLALAAGQSVDVAGEWDGFSFLPQAAAVAGRDGQLIA